MRIRITHIARPYHKSFVNFHRLLSSCRHRIFMRFGEIVKTQIFLEGRRHNFRRETLVPHEIVINSSGTMSC